MCIPCNLTFMNALCMSINYVLSLVLAEEAPWLIFEFMEYGDLASVLRSTSTNSEVSESLEQKPCLTKVNMCTWNMFEFCMEYLFIRFICLLSLCIRCSFSRH